MADQYTSIENLKFLLYDVHKAEDILAHPHYEDYDREAIDILLESAKDMADQQLFPYFQEMDTDPVRYEDGKVIVHPQMEKVIKEMSEAGWISAGFDYDDGGMRLPTLANLAAYHIFTAANNSATGYISLTSGAARLIISFGDATLKEKFASKMLSGQWMGTMALTEPQAGSSLSDITTTATPTEDGYYKIKGQKIFISGGDHQYAENFVHLTLARIEGAPKGTKGISLFAIPKHRPAADGSLESNDVITAGDFEKMGQKGYATTHLVFGEADNCQGWLVGEPNQGLKYMFQMMNAARIEVGLTAASTATAAYYASLQYAKERPQGRKLTKDGRKDVSKEQTLIINHPDVRRMLLLQKAITEGAMSLLMGCGRLEDILKTGEGQEKEEAHLMLELLTPIAKTYPSEMGRVAVNNGLQVLGGYGFCTDFPLQQYYRDIRIMSIYEGTTGIQSLDLLGRKMTMQNGAAPKLLAQAIQETIKEASTHDSLKPYAKTLGEKLGDINRVMQQLLQYAQKGNYERFLADASLFMEFTSTIVIGWQWLKMAIVAKNALVTGNTPFGNAFYESKIHTMKFYYRYEMPKTLGLMQSLMDTEQLTIASEKEVIV